MLCAAGDSEKSDLIGSCWLQEKKLKREDDDRIDGGWLAIAAAYSKVVSPLGC